MKLFRKLIKFLFIIILIGASICCIIGYSTYNQAVKEKPLLSRIEEITNKENNTIGLNEEIENLISGNEETNNTKNSEKLNEEIVNEM